MDGVPGGWVVAVISDGRVRWSVQPDATAVLAATHACAAVGVDMAPGDVLFFNGSLVHGSGPNRSVDRFRRSFICHYVGRSAERMSRWYRPILTMSGDEVTIDDNTGGGPCGTEAAGPH